MLSHSCCWGVRSLLSKWHNWLGKKHKISQPRGLHPTTLWHQQGTRKHTSLGEEFCSGHSPRAVQSWVAVQSNNAVRPQGHEMRLTRFRDAAGTREKCGFLVRGWMSTTNHFPWVLSQVFKWVHFGHAYASFVFTFHERSSSGDLHTWTLVESEFKACMLEHSQIDN